MLKRLFKAMFDVVRLAPINQAEHDLRACVPYADVLAGALDNWQDAYLAWVAANATYRSYSMIEETSPYYDADTAHTLRATLDNAVSHCQLMNYRLNSILAQETPKGS